MSKNIGTIDRVVRIVLGLIIIVYGVLNNSFLGLIGIIPLLTGVISFCPLYKILKIDTCSCK